MTFNLEWIRHATRVRNLWLPWWILKWRAIFRQILHTFAAIQVIRIVLLSTSLLHHNWDPFLFIVSNEPYTWYVSNKDDEYVQQGRVEQDLLWLSAEWSMQLHGGSIIMHGLVGRYCPLAHLSGHATVRCHTSLSACCYHHKSKRG